MSEIKVKVKTKADVVTSGGGTIANKSGGTPSKGRRGTVVVFTTVERPRRSLKER